MEAKLRLTRLLTSLSKVSRIMKTGGTSSSRCFIIEIGIVSIRLYLQSSNLNFPPLASRNLPFSSRNLHLTFSENHRESVSFSILKIYPRHSRKINDISIVSIKLYLRGSNLNCSPLACRNWPCLAPATP